MAPVVKLYAVAGESRGAYQGVQKRHQDIQRIEQTIAELAQLFNDVRQGRMSGPISLEQRSQVIMHLHW
ncbi:hypothetical protein JVT61DRAFT_1437 [Boletus reticuloceps]|uniref:Uncharacterized protein n=1 Tax=Boletus reticuloceps TaxID=495285 RepID=A0A8I2YC27_9AGAM|nr:hypothetical protein JVT61DRAFT_1417 [Boletus reticuloceps]KAG6369135.1 hypothetical protein JVT61DRAFT_1437 [Boletus reticuloceps]